MKMNLLLILLFAICNRLRGADRFTIIGKAGISVFLFYSLWPSWFVGFVVVVLYIIGQSCGWGWWIGAILNRKPNTKPVKGFRESIADWISHKIFSNYLWRSRMALALIGLIWWLPVIFCYSVSWMSIAALLLCSIGFPVAFEISSKLPKIKIALFDHSWEMGELIYGAFQGLAIYLIWR